MSTEFESSILYTDLDSLFDTRLATLHRFGLETVDRVIRNGYFTRICDEFDGVPPEKFQEAYDQRNLETLKQAMITPVIEMINLFAKQTLVAVVASPFRRQPKVYLNIYPYVLDEAFEKQIIMGLVAATKNNVDVELVNINPEDLTPKYVKENFVQIIMYGYNTWLDIHSANKNFADTQCPQVSLFAPALMRSQEMTKIMKGQDVFGALETYASLFIKLTMLPATIFSVDTARLKVVKKPE